MSILLPLLQTLVSGISGPLSLSLSGPVLINCSRVPISKLITARAVNSKIRVLSLKNYHIYIYICMLLLALFILLLLLLHMCINIRLLIVLDASLPYWWARHGGVFSVGTYKCRLPLYIIVNAHLLPHNM